MKRIVNFNSVATLLDRLAIHAVIRAQFQERMEESGDKEYEVKIGVQNETVDALKDELNKLLIDIFKQKKYEVIKEKRSFE